MTDPTQDELLRLLSNQSRRQTVRFLQNTPNGDVGIEQLRDHIVREAGDIGVKKDDIVIQLHHHHLPKLREKGLIDYDPIDHRVTYYSNPQIEAVLDKISPKSPPAVSDN